MDLVIFGLLNIMILAVGFVIVSRRVERQFGSRVFLDKIESEANTIITELNATTERNIRILEDTMASLQEMIGRAETVENRLAAIAPPLAPEPPTPERAPRSISPVGLPIAAERLVANQLAPAAVDGGSSNPQDWILRLHAQGYDSETIAAKVSRTVGEVDLIIRLSGNR